MKNRFENTFREDDAKQELFGKPKVNKGKKLLNTKMNDSNDFDNIDKVLVSDLGYKKVLQGSGDPLITNLAEGEVYYIISEMDSILKGSSIKEAESYIEVRTDINKVYKCKYNEKFAVDDPIPWTDKEEEAFKNTKFEVVE